VWRGALTKSWHDFSEKKATIFWDVNIFLQVSENIRKIIERKQVR